MATSDPYFGTDRARLAGVGVAVAVHVLLIGFLVSYAPARDVLKTMAPMMAQLIRPELPAPPMPKPEPNVEKLPKPLPVNVEKLPKPLPVKKVQPRVEPDTPLLVVPAPAASVPAINVPPDPKPSPPIEVRAAPPAPPAPAAPAPIVPPRFNADYLDNPAPMYPSLARRMGEEGKVLLRVYVEASGLPSQVEIRTSSGLERLDQAALEAVRRWKFVPAKQSDQAVPAFVVVPISFNLKG